MTPASAGRKADPNPLRSIPAKLLGWYDRHHRDLPWRISPSMRAQGVTADPYHVWLSEIMLQQTTVAAVKPYFAKFLDRWPTVSELAAADTDDIMKAWAGLGYYSRARNLKKCAEQVVAEHGGRFPRTVEHLRCLPGIGAYTAAAIASIAFNEPAAVVDGNIERVIARLMRIETPLPAAKPEITAIVAGIVPIERPGDFAQAMMDLGATICTPRRPACIACPLNDDCAALGTGEPEIYPRKIAKADKPVRVGAAFVAVDQSGAILLRKRADKGLLAGMAEVPTTSWTARLDGETSIDAAPFTAPWRHAGEITHVFTHFELRLTVYTAHIDTAQAPDDHWWAAAIHGEALPTVMKKAIEAAVPGITRGVRNGTRP